MANNKNGEIKNIQNIGSSAHKINVYYLLDFEIPFKQLWKCLETNSYFRNTVWSKIMGEEKG